MGSKVKTTSNGATPVANDFNQFLQRGIVTGTYGNGAINQTQGMGGAINNLINQSGANAENAGWRDVLARMQMSGAVPQVGNAFAGMPNLNIAGRVGNTDTGAAGINAPAFSAIQQMVQNQKARDLGDIRGRYGLGSADQNAEALYNSQVNPAMVNQLTNTSNSFRQLAQGDIGLNLQGLGLASQDQIARGYMNQRGQMANAANALQLLGLQSQTALGGGNLMLQQGNQQLSALDSLMRMYGLTDQIGTPQAQSYQTGGLLNDILGGGQGLLNLWNGYQQARNNMGGGNNMGGNYNLPPNLYDPSTLQPGTTPSNPGPYYLPPPQPTLP